jgi:hypothetical protein
MAWSLKFANPILLPNGKKLTSLREAGEHIAKLPQTEHDSKERQTAMHCLLQAADHGGPVDFARIGVMQALHRHEEKVNDASRKDPKWNNRYKLVRNR